MLVITTDLTSSLIYDKDNALGALTEELQNKE